MGPRIDCRVSGRTWPEKGVVRPNLSGARFAAAALTISGSSHRFLEQIQGETRRPGRYRAGGRVMAAFQPAPTSRASASRLGSNDRVRPKADIGEARPKPIGYEIMRSTGRKSAMSEGETARKNGSRYWEKPMLRPHAVWSIAAVLIGTADIAAAHAEVRPTFTVFGPPSFERSLQQIDAIFTRATGQAVVLRVAASPKLEQLVEQGERPDVIIATAHRLSRLSHEGLVRPQSREALASVHLVLVEPKGAHVPLRSIYPGFPIGQVLGPYGKIAVPNAEGSAAGSRAMTALISLSGWLAIATRIIREPSSQDALNALASGDAILAVAYDSDEVPGLSSRT